MRRWKVLPCQGWRVFRLCCGNLRRHLRKLLVYHVRVEQHEVVFEVVLLEMSRCTQLTAPCLFLPPPPCFPTYRGVGVMLGGTALAAPQAARAVLEEGMARGACVTVSVTPFEPSDGAPLS
jgi:hypothetical protein